MCLGKTLYSHSAYPPLKYNEVPVNLIGGNLGKPREPEGGGGEGFVNDWHPM